MDNGSAPATKQDLAELKAELLAADARLKAELKEELLAASRETNERLKTELKEELLEAMYDIETHLLKGFYGFVESTQKASD